MSPFSMIFSRSPRSSKRGFISAQWSLFLLLINSYCRRLLRLRRSSRQINIKLHNNLSQKVKRNRRICHWGYTQYQIAFYLHSIRILSQSTLHWVLILSWTLHNTNCSSFLPDQKSTSISTLQGILTNNKLYIGLISCFGQPTAQFVHCSTFDQLCSVFLPLYNFCRSFSP